MKAMRSKMLPSEGCSWWFERFEFTHIEFNWHYHPEYEICLTLNSEGSKNIGDHVDYYNCADFVLLGPNLPHSWQAQAQNKDLPLVVYVAQIPAQWLDELVANNPELLVLADMLKLSMRGIEYSHETIKSALPVFKAMNNADPIERYILLMQLLNVMVKDENYRILSSSFFTFGDKTDISVDKLDKVISHIYEHYTDPLSAGELASLAHMSTNHFHRFFKKRTEQTLNQFINQLRIGKACKLLIHTNALISVISDQCGFNNISNFNRRFRMVKGNTPKEFRKSIRVPSPL
jgi:AraC-like DNA-binding protein